MIVKSLADQGSITNWELWQDVWHEVSPGMEAALTRHLDEVISLLTGVMQSPSWHVKAQVSWAIFLFSGENSLHAVWQGMATFSPEKGPYYLCVKSCMVPRSVRVGCCSSPPLKWPKWRCKTVELYSCEPSCFLFYKFTATLTVL